jgi:hypothetical protein
LAETTPHPIIIDDIFKRWLKLIELIIAPCVLSTEYLKENWEQESPAESVPDSKRCGDIPKRVKEYLF